MENKKSDLKILFIGKAGDPYSTAAADYLQTRFHNPLVIYSQRTAEMPAELMEWEGDLLISYLAQWIIPGALLGKARLAAINFHPGPPEYPGIGCTNFAVYNEEKEFGITCHHMLARVDSGSIIAVTRFPVLPVDTVYTITQRCYIHILHTFYEVAEGLYHTGTLPASTETWKRKPYTRKQLNELCLLEPGMDTGEIQRRLKATTFGERVWAQVKVGSDKYPYETALEKGFI